MKKSLISKVFAISASALFVFSSCNKIQEDAPLERGLDAKLSVVNGRLVFASREDLDKTISYLVSKENTPEHRDFDLKYKYTSSERAYRNLTEEQSLAILEAGNTRGYENIVVLVDDAITPGERELLPVIDEPTMATIANQDGLFQIANKIYKCEYKKLKCITDGNESTITELGGIDESNILPNVEVTPIIRENLSRISSYGEVYWGCTGTPPNVDCGRRMLAELANINNGLWSSLYGNQRGQKRSCPFGICSWAAGSTSSMRLVMTGVWQDANLINSPIYNINYNSGEILGETKISKTIDICTFQTCSFHCDLSGVHYVKGGGSADGMVYCNTHLAF